MGFSKFDQQWKTAAGVIQRLVEIVSKGGNYLLNIGPTGDGTIPAPSAAVLEKVGTWMQANGESIYGTSACAAQFPWGRCTVKGGKVYLHVFTWPADSMLRVNGIGNQVRSAYPLMDPRRRLSVSRESGVTAIALPPALPRDEKDTVIVMEIAGAPVMETPMISQGSDSPFELNYMAAITSGKAMKCFNRDGKYHISKWTGPGDSVTWRLLVSQTGSYKVRIRYAARAAWAGRRFTVNVAGHTLTAKVEATGDWYGYKTFELGTVTLPKAGEYSATIRPAEASDHYLMYFESLRLEPSQVMID